MNAPEKNSAASQDVRRQALKDRAEDLAHRIENAPPRAAMPLIAFSLASANYAVEARFVREIYPLKSLTPIPCTPDFVLGLVNVRGELYPVIDLRKFLGVKEVGLTNAARVVVLHTEAMSIGILADVVHGIRGIEASDIRPVPVGFTTIDPAFCRGVMEDNVLILDAARLLAHPRLVVNEHVTA